MQTIHFKVAANNSFRRFSLANPSLESLKTQVASLFGIASLDGWTIKYKDEENQLVSIASDEELSYAAQFIGGNKVLHLIVAFPGGLGECAWNNNKHHRKGRSEDKDRWAARLHKKQERIRGRLVSLESSDHPRAKAQASKLEDEIATIAMELDTLNIRDEKRNITPENTSVELATALLNSPKHTERKTVRCNKISCLQRKQDRVGEKLLELSACPESPKKQAKISKLTEKLTAISAKLEVLEKEPSPNSNSSSSSSNANSELKEENSKQQSEPVPDISADKQLVEEVKSKFFSLRRELHQDRMNLISLGKVLGALRVISRHGGAAGIAPVNDEQLAQTEISLGLAKDEFAAKKLVIQQQKELLCNLSQQLGFGKSWKDKKEKKDKKDWKHKKEEREKHVKKGRVEKSDRKKCEKKISQGKEMRIQRTRKTFFQKAGILFRQ